MKKATLIGLGAITALGMSAAPITPEQALERLSNGRNGIVAASAIENVPVWTSVTPTGKNGAYVFNNRGGNGFVILSADDAAYPVLGYSENGTFDKDNIAPQLKWWLEIMGREMEYYVSRGATEVQSAPVYAGMERIEPLVSSRWNQDAPYNNNCPKISGKSTYTGCVATSMAQVMYYHKYPEIGEGRIFYRWTKDGGRGLTLNLGDKAFDWNNMIDEYQRGAYSDAQADAVAYLMQCCGYSVKMDYGTEASGTQGSLIADALKNYFKYDQNISVKYRAPYSASQWASMVYDNLKNCGPLVMNGHPYEDSGHSFVCDGYDGKGYFHFNWGWGGMSDGWFLLESMNPEAQGIGGAAAGGGFNYGLNGIFGAQPPTGAPAVTEYDNIMMYGSVTATIQNGDIEFTRTAWYPSGWFAAAGHTIVVNVGIIVEPVDGTSGQKQTVEGKFQGNTRVTLEPGSYYPTTKGPVAKMPTGLADGRYKVTIGVKDLAKDNAPYQPILCPYAAPNYVYVNVANGSMTVENVAVPHLEAKGLTLDTDLYADRMAKYTVKLKNTSEYELTETIAPGLVKNGRVVMVGGLAPTTVNANTEAETTWIATMYPVEGYSNPTDVTEYELAVVDPVTYEIMGTYGNVSMNPATVQTQLMLDTFELKGMEQQSEESPTGGFRSVYMVPNPDNFTAYLKYTVWDGFFDGLLSVDIYKSNPEDSSDNEVVLNGIYQDQPFLHMDESQALDIPVNFAAAASNTLYMLRVTYTAGRSQKSLGSLYFRKGVAGVNGITVDNDADVKYYNLQGVEIETPASGQIVIVKKGSKAYKTKF